MKSLAAVEEDEESSDSEVSVFKVEHIAQQKRTIFGQLDFIIEDAVVTMAS